MSILKRYNEFLETPKYQGMDPKEDDTVEQDVNSTESLDQALDKLTKEGGEITWNQYKISTPSELNSPGEEPVFLIDKNGKHAKAKTKDEVIKVVSEQVVFESFRNKYRRRK